MKKSKFIVLILVGLLLLSGCSEPDIPNSGSAFSEVSDPMDASDISDDKAGTGSHKTITFGFGFNEENIEYENGKLVLMPILKGADESTTAGFLVFIDGILQEYSVSDSTSKSYVSTFDTIPNGEETIKLTIDAAKADDSLEEHIICVCSMLCPDFIPTAEHPQFGFYHSILVAKPNMLPIDNIETAIFHKTKAIRVENAVLTKAQKDKYSQGEDENHEPILSAFELIQKEGTGIKSDSYVLKNGESSLNLLFATCTSDPYAANYRVSFYKNHLPCKFNGDKDFLEITMEGGKITEADITLEDVKEGDVVYCIATPLGDDITCGVYKSKSCLVVGADGGSAPNETPNPPQNVTATGIELGKSKPVFSMGNTMYFINSTGFSPDTQRGILLCSSKNGKDIDKTIEIGTATPKAHGDYISLLCSDGGDIWARLYDKNLNEVKSAKLNSILGDNFVFEVNALNVDNVDFDFDKIAYVSDFGKLCICDWDLNNFKDLMTLPCNEASDASAFNAIHISGENIAFIASGHVENQNQEYYGVCSLDGKYELKRKDNVDVPQANDDCIVWGDRHVALDKLPSGKIEIFKDGKFETLKTVEQAESQYVFLGDSSVMTFSGNGNSLRKYTKDGSSEIPLEQGEHGVTAVECGNRIFVESYGADNKNKTYSIEVN